MNIPCGSAKAALHTGLNILSGSQGTACLQLGCALHQKRGVGGTCTFCLKSF
ncbi:hypothetical protein ABBQ32_007160 [Trebouxia sp. C0010 RCD-2024]